MLLLRKVLAFCFWELRRIIFSISGDWLLDFRAMCLLVYTEGGLILIFLGVASILLNHRLLPNQGISLILWGVLFVGAVTVFNYYELQYKDRWKEFEPEFQAYSKSKTAIGCLVMIALLILTAAAMSWTATTMARFSL